MKRKHISLILSISVLLILLITFFSSDNKSSQTTQLDVVRDMDGDTYIAQEEEMVLSDDVKSSPLIIDSNSSVIETSSMASNDLKIISFLHTVASNANSDVIQLLKEWELSSVEYFNPPTDDPEHTLFLFLPPPDEELNRQAGEIILTAFEKNGMDQYEIDAEVVNAVKGLVEWPQGNRIVMANADKDMNGSVVVFENVSDDMINEIRNGEQSQYDAGFVIDSSLMKLDLMNFMNPNRFSHLYEPIQ